MAQLSRTTLRVGFPFTGCFTAGPRWQARPGQITADSRDWVFRRGRMFRRGGSAIIGDTLNGSTEVSGLLESKWAAKARRAGAVKLPSLTDKYPTLGVLYQNDANKFGEFFWFNSNPAGTALYVAWEDLRVATDQRYVQKLSAAGAAQWTANGVQLSNQIGTGGFSFAPALLPDGGGGCIIVTQISQGGAPLEPKAWRVRSDGTAVFGVLGGAGVSLDTGGTTSTTSPRICTDSAGGLIAAWSTNDILVNRLSNLGAYPAGWSGTPLTICNAAGVQAYPDICADGSGNAIVAWEDQRSGNYQIYAQKVTAGHAVAWAANGVLLSNGAAVDARSPRVIADPSGGAFIAWLDNRSGSFQPYLTRIDSTGAVVAGWPASGLLCGTGSSSSFASPFTQGVALCSDAAGGVFAFWVDNRAALSLYGQRVNGAGVVQLAAAGIVIGAAASSNRPSAVQDATTGCFVSWNGTAGTVAAACSVQHLTAAGALFAAAVTPATSATVNEVAWTQLARDGFGGCVAVWGQGGVGNLNVFSRRINADGSFPWSTPTTVCNSAGEQQYMGIASDAAGVATTANQVIGKEFGSLHYSTAASTECQMKVVPYAYESLNGETGISRFTFEFTRRFHAQLSRSFLQVGNWVYFPNGYRWNGKFNDSTDGGTERLRFFPTGHTRPLRMPDITKGTDKGAVSAAAANSWPWLGSDAFFYTVIYVWEDGSMSAPIQCRATNTDLPNGYGFVAAIDSVNPTHAFDSIVWSNIPIGPDGVKQRILARSTKVTSTVTTGAGYPVITNDMRVVAVLNNNHQTSYTDTNGSDGGLKVDSNVTRLFDSKWPDRARYIGKCDGHVLLGRLKPNINAIILAPTGVTVAGDINATDDNAALYGTKVFLWRVPGDGTLRLRKVTTPGAPTEISIATAGVVSLQTIVDKINATTPASACGEWRAQLAPGVDGSAYAFYLAPTSYGIVGCTGNTGESVITGGFANAAVGMRISGHGSIPAGSIVIAINSTATQCTIGNTSGTAAVLTGNIPATTLTVYVDTGDDAHVTDGSLGNVRAFGQSYPAVIPFTSSALDSGYLATFTERNQAMAFSGAAPGHAPYAANNWYVGNEHSVPSLHGNLMGFGNLGAAALVLYERAIARFWNPRAGGTHDDADYHLIVINEHRGCISPYSIVEANGTAGWLDGAGFFVSAGEQGDEICISGDMYDPATNTGEWAYAINACRAAAASDAEDFPFHASVMNGVLYVNYAVDATTIRQTRYDFSGGLTRRGIGEWLDENGALYPWSAPVTLSGVAMAAVPRSDALHLYMARDTNAGVADGRVDEIETGTQDSNTGITPGAYEAAVPEDGSVAVPGTVGPVAYSRLEAPAEFIVYELDQLKPRWKKAGAGLSIAIATDLDRTAFDTIALASSGASEFADLVIDHPNHVNKLLRTIEIKITDDGTGPTPEVAGIPLKCKVVEAFN